MGQMIVSSLMKASDKPQEEGAGLFRSRRARRLFRFACWTNIAVGSAVIVWNIVMIVMIVKHLI